jgi:hypothetical protein
MNCREKQNKYQFQKNENTDDQDFHMPILIIHFRQFGELFELNLRNYTTYDLKKVIPQFRTLFY